MEPTDRELVDITRQWAEKGGGDPDKFVLGFALGRIKRRLDQILWVLGLIVAIGTIALVHFW